MQFPNRPVFCVRLLNLALKPCICLCLHGKPLRQSLSKVQWAGFSCGTACGQPHSVASALGLPRLFTGRFSFNISFLSCLTDSSNADRVWVSVEVEEEHRKVCVQVMICSDSRGTIKLWSSSLTDQWSGLIPTFLTFRAKFQTKEIRVSSIRKLQHLLTGMVHETSHYFYLCL